MKVSSVKNHWLFLILCVSLIFLFILDRKSLLRKNQQYPITASFYPNHSYLLSPNIFNLQNQSVDFATKSVISWPSCTEEENNRADVASTASTNNHHKGPHNTRSTHSYLRRPLSSCSKPGFKYTFFNCSVFLFKSQKSLTLHSLSI